jgi:hypothetical protein
MIFIKDLRGRLNFTFKNKRAEGFVKYPSALYLRNIIFR